ncbi:MAG: hypothetical protein OXG81_00625 [Acidobacteria bacterium]|nr:hypothetical protein [Acidobacteriota bacterium]
MRLSNRRIVRSLTCLTVLLVCASAPLAAQRGIDLLDAKQVLRTGDPPVQSVGTGAVRITVADATTGVVQKTHVNETYQYDDGEFENFEDGSTLEPAAPLIGGVVEWAQRFEVDSNSALVSVRVCFLRPDNDVNRSVDFKLRFYGDEVSNRVSNPGRRGGLVYIIEEDIRRAGEHRCFRLRGSLVGKQLRKGTHWVGIEWNAATQKRLGGDHYTADDQAETDRSNRAVHVTEVRYRNLPVAPDARDDGWNDPRGGDRLSTTRGLKAIGVSLEVEVEHAPVPDPTPDPTPDPGPGPAPDSSCSGGTCHLQDGRFRVRTRYVLAGMSGQTAEGTMSGGAGLFTFGGDDPELLVRMVDDCGGSGYWMLYAGAATDADYAIAIRDTMSNTLRWFRARAGGSIRDMAFACTN